MPSFFVFPNSKFPRTFWTKRKISYREFSIVIFSPRYFSETMCIFRDSFFWHIRRRREFGLKNKFDFWKFLKFWRRNVSDASKINLSSTQRFAVETRGRIQSWFFFSPQSRFDHRRIPSTNNRVDGHGVPLDSSDYKCRKQRRKMHNAAFNFQTLIQ